MINKATEVIIGVNYDKTIGNDVMIFGTGGIYTEVMKDTSLSKSRELYNSDILFDSQAKTGVTDKEMLNAYITYKITIRNQSQNILAQIDEIVDLLINNTKLSYKDIANQYMVSQNTILNISQGYTYFNPNLSYPLRKNNHDSNAKDSVLDYFDSEKDLLDLKDDLYYRWDLKIENDLTKKYNIPLKILRQINQGDIFKDIGNYNYPIRNKNIRNNQNFTIDDVLNILSDLRNSKESMTNIGLKYKIHRNTVSKINKGEAYIIKDYDYPAR